MRFLHRKNRLEPPKETLSRMSGDLACSFSGKEVKTVLSNQRTGRPSWISNHSKK